MARTHDRAGRGPRRPPGRDGEQQFRCVVCAMIISCAPEVAGVQNRNHCPSCLCSRHVDWREPGDRLASCRAPMEPVGLTTKRGRNKYARERDGELMLIHRCTGCGKLVINRVAADDGPDALLAIFERSLAIGPGLAAALELQGIDPLRACDRELLLTRLFGEAPALRERRAAV